MPLTNLLVPTYRHMLQALSNWLEKAQTQLGVEKADALMSEQIAADMFPLATQIRFACVQAQEAIFRLQDKEFPPSIATLLSEGRNAGEQPGSIADAQARISETIRLLDSLGPTALDVEPDQPIAHILPNGMIFDLSAEQYARDWTLGQFYFHVMIAYAILRGAGVELGKADYVAHMLPHLRPGTMPHA